MKKPALAKNQKPALAGEHRPGHLASEPLLLAVALVAWWCLAVGSTLGKSATSDEPLHIIGGASYWLLDDYRLQPENGNLSQRWCGLPLFLAGWPLPSFEHPGWAKSDMASLSQAYLFQSGNPSWLILAAARSFAAVWGVFIALLVYHWSRELFGSTAAWLSLAFCLFDTTLLANGPLATSDTCAAFFFCWSTWSIWRMLQLPSPARAALAALAVAGLFVAKFSAPVEIVVALILLVVRSRFGPEWEVAWAGQRRRVSTGAGLAAVAACVVLISATAWLVVWMAYGFRYEAMNLNAAPAGTLARFGTLSAAAQELGGLKSRLLMFLGERHLLPEAYLYGGAYVLNTMLRQSFFCGDYSVAGTWRYFPFTFLVKTSLATLAAIVTLAMMASRLRRSPAAERPATKLLEANDWYSLTPLVALLAVYWATSLVATLNIGHRHLLPVYPPTFVLLGGLPRLCRQQAWLRRLPWALAGYAGVVCFWTFPHYLAFFNGIVARDNAWHYLVDSNLDWGQEHYALEAFVAKERRRYGVNHPVYGCLFDATPQGTGVAALTPLPTSFQPVPLPPLGPGTYCVSATHLQGIYLQIWGPWTARREERYQDRVRAVALLGPLSANERQERYGIAPDLYAQIVEDRRRLEYYRFLAQLRERVPDAVINGAIIVHRLDPAAFDAILHAEAPAQAARFSSSPLFD